MRVLKTILVLLFIVVVGAFGFAAAEDSVPAPAPPARPSIAITGPNADRLTQGDTYTITWKATGLQRVRLVAVGMRTTYPGRDRGQFHGLISRGRSSGSGSARWKVPFLDTLKFRVVAKGFDQHNRLAATADRVYVFRPVSLKDKTADGIYVDLHDENHQRLYVMKNNIVTRAYLTSGARSNAFYPPNMHPKTTHDHIGVFHVMAKYPVWHSKEFDVDMYWAMRYLNGHFIHATYPNLYHQLGRAASHGCNRLTREQAKELYDMTPVGTRVEIIGPLHRH